MSEISAEFEPGLREGLARAYAVRFSDQELADIEAFFATPSGAAFAPASFDIMADPQVIAATIEDMPVMLERMPDMLEGVQARIAALPGPRSFADLSDAERADVASILGISIEELKTDMQADR